MVGGGQFSALIFLVLVVSNGGVLVELVVAVSLPRPFPRTGLSTSRKINFVYGPLLGVRGCPYGLAFPAPESPGNRVLHPTTDSSTRKMTISGPESAKNRLNQAILSVNSCDFCADIQIYYS